MPAIMKTLGFGDDNYVLGLCCEHHPEMPEYQALDLLTPLNQPALSRIVSHTGNHWRKIFNVSAKLLFELNFQLHSAQSWQEYRDDCLFSGHSLSALIWSEPIYSQHRLHIITGKTYALGLPFGDEFVWLNNQFAVNEQLNLLVCPYLDYRQLSNKKITELVALIHQFFPAWCDSNLAS